MGGSTICCRDQRWLHICQRDDRLQTGCNGKNIQASPYDNTVQYLYRAMFGVHRNILCISELCYKGTILQRDYRKMAINGHFPIIPL